MYGNCVRGRWQAGRPGIGYRTTFDSEPRNRSCRNCALVYSFQPPFSPHPRFSRSGTGAPVTSTTGMVVTTSAPASDVGAAILKKGGNAIDAAVATAFALAVTHPSAGNIGGGGFMVIRPAKGAPMTIDYRERAPLKSTQDDVPRLDGQDRSRSARRPDISRRASRAPFAVSPWRTRKFGKLPWKDVVLPAVDLAEKGFVLSPDLARSLNREVAGSNGAVSGVGRGVRQAGRRPVDRRRHDRARDLARTLRAIATKGPTRSTPAGSPTASPRRWRRTAASSRRRISRHTRRRRARRSAASIAATRSSRCRRRAAAASR